MMMIFNLYCGIVKYCLTYFIIIHYCTGDCEHCAELTRLIPFSRLQYSAVLFSDLFVVPLLMRELRLTEEAW